MAKDFNLNLEFLREQPREYLLEVVEYLVPLTLKYRQPQRTEEVINESLYRNKVIDELVVIVETYAGELDPECAQMVWDVAGMLREQKMRR